MAEREEQVLCIVTRAVRSLDGVESGREVILSRAAAHEHARRGRVLIMGELTPTTDKSEEE
jgi:hypothetical protein